MTPQHSGSRRIARRTLSITMCPGLALAAVAASISEGCGDPEQVPEGSGQVAHAMVAAGPWSFGESLPATDGMPAGLAARLERAWAAHPAGYQPRTRHLRAAGLPKYTNRLFLASSPYLRQHAHNPVNWYPWGKEALEAAARLGRPILLSIGYSTCHWCHVMEEQSFEDEAVARYLNEHYIAIKVDREERPDIDGIYMAAVQQISGRGGWPLTVWLTPDRRPFFGGTYIPRGAFLRALRTLRGDYERDPDGIAEQAAEVTAAIRRELEPVMAGGGAVLPDAAILHEAARIFTGRLDEKNGGSVGLPRFPSGMPVRFLLRYHRRTGDRRALRASVLTLEKMAAGGIYDQVGGGFHRYSTDRAWLVPHFEKMLYDNALLVMTYAEAYQVTGREEFARIVRETLRWADRDMSSPEGGFYSASDADSPAPGGGLEEGRFYTWTPADLVAALGPERARVAGAYYGVTEDGDFEGRSVLRVAGTSAARPRDLADIAGALYQARARRPPPLRDDKMLVDWNGLMISAHVQAALALGEPEYARRAARAAEALWARARGQDGRLYHTAAAGDARIAAYIEDHAFLAAALLDVQEATSDPKWLERAIDLDRVVERHFEDRKAGRFFRTSDDHEELLARERTYYDGVLPTGPSVHVRNLLRLYELTGQESYRQRAERALAHYGATLRQVPSAMSEMLLAVDHFLDRPKQIVIVGRETHAEAAPFLAALRRAFVPNRALIVTGQADIERLAHRIPLVAGKIARKGLATAYVCERGVCELPTADPAVFARQLRAVHRLARPAAGRR